MNRVNFLKSHYGFSLVETLVAVGLLAIVAAGVSTLFVQSKVKTTSLVGDADVRNVVDKIRLTLNDRAACTMTFKTVGNVLPSTNLSTATSATPRTVNNILAANSSVLYQTGQNYGNNNIKLQLMEVDLWYGKTAAPDSIGQFRLKVTMQKLDHNGVGPTTKSFYILFGARVNAANTVVDCYSYLDDEYLLRNGSNFMIGQLVVSSTTMGVHITNGWAQASHFIAMSDQRLKHNISDIVNASETLQKVKGVQFNWNVDNSQDMGFIAQDLEMVVPHVVNTNVTTGLKSVSYSSLLPALVEKYKALIQESRQNQKQVNKLIKKAKVSNYDTLTQ